MKILEKNLLDFYFFKMLHYVQGKFFCLGNGFLKKQFEKYFDFETYNGRIKDFIHNKEKCDILFNFAGVIGRPNVDALETPDGFLKLLGCMLDTIYLFEYCEQNNIYLINFTTGCIYTGPANKDDKPNYYGSTYSMIKAVQQRYFDMSKYKHILNLRVRMPITGEYEIVNDTLIKKDKTTPDIKEDLYFKLNNYEFMDDVFDSATYIPEAAKTLNGLINEHKIGNYNLTNIIINPHELFKNKPSKKANYSNRSHCILNNY